MSQPLVSIIVPIYKVEKYLERCLDSIIAQDYRPLELILVNDGSPDGCGEIIRRYEAKYPFIKSIWQENSGLSAARNAGITGATGKYLSMIDSDDYVEPDFIDSLVRIAEEGNAEVVICNFFLDFPNGFKVPFPLMTLQKKMSGDKAAQMSLKLLSIPVFAWNKLYRRELFTEHSISFPSIYYEDIATASRVLIRAQSVAITRKVFYHYCLRSSGITGNFGIKNIVDYLKAVDIIRHFIWEEQLWDSWEKPYRNFLRAVKTQLIFEIAIQKNSIPFNDRHSWIRQINQKIRELSVAPVTVESEINNSLPV